MLNRLSLRKGLRAIIGGITSVAGFALEHSEELSNLFPHPKIAVALQIAGVILAVFGHSPVKHTPDKPIEDIVAEK